MKLTAKNLLIAILVPIPILILTYLDVMTGQVENAIWMSPWLCWPLILLGPFGFGWVFISSYRNQGTPREFDYVVALWITVSLLWFCLLLFVDLVFLEAIGGHK
jgi:hypothetical protein